MKGEGKLPQAREAASAEENNATHAGNCTERERGGFALSHLERGALNFLLRAIRAAERFQASSLEATRKLGNLNAGWL